MIDIAWIIPLLPLLGFLITGFFYKRMPNKVSAFVACSSVLLAFLFSLGVAFQVFANGIVKNITLFDWIAFGDYAFSFELKFDALSSVMMLVVTGVGFLIHLYSIGYMKEDEGFNRFFAYLNLFIFFMLVLVTAANYLIVFIGWEGVGLCSYLLIGFWFKSHENNNAAKKAFIMNRIGDLGFLLGMFMILKTFGTLSFDAVFNTAMGFDIGKPEIVAITLLLFIGATGKSAQIPLYTWLPDAMAGPTPVSALIHAATMVTAGVYLVVRSNILYSLAPFTQTVILITGLLTALLAGIIATRQYDIKKVLAYSTISQLGLMFMGLGVGAYVSSTFHLVTHAFFKALLFLAAGSVIHAMGGEQDIRKMGGLKDKVKITWAVFLVGTIAISGIPPFSGFFSKDEIMLALYMKNPLYWAMGLFISMLTAFYMFRLLYITFYGKYRNSESIHVHESPKIMTLPLIVLAILSALGGVVNLPSYIGKARLEHAMSTIIFDNGTRDLFHVSLSREFMLMGITLLVIIASIVVARAWFKKDRDYSFVSRSGIKGIIDNKFYIDELYRLIIERPLMWLSDKFYNVIEIKVIDRAVNSVGDITTCASRIFRYMQSGNLGYYLLAMVVSIAVILAYAVFV